MQRNSQNRPTPLCAEGHHHFPSVQVGFDDGRLRIFDTAAAVLAGEMRQHGSGIRDIAFDAGGGRLYTSGIAAPPQPGFSQLQPRWRKCQAVMLQGQPGSSTALAMQCIRKSRLYCNRWTQVQAKMARFVC